jgi:hypothetical protein
MRPNGTMTVRRSGARELLAPHDLPSIVHAMRLEPAPRSVEPDRDDLRRLSLLRSSTATISDAATWPRPAGASISLLKGHMGMAPVRGRNFGQLGVAVRLAYDRAAGIEAFESALDASLRVHWADADRGAHDRDRAVPRLASGGA